MNMKFVVRSIAVTLALSLFSHVARAETIKIAMIDPVSGFFATTGQNLLKSYQTFAELAAKENWIDAGHTLDFVSFDSKGDGKEAMIQLQAALDQGFRFIAQGTNSDIAAAYIDAIEKHNAENPGKEVVLINHGAVDPDLTNEKCSFWHFRFDANSDMKMEAITRMIEIDDNIKKVYIIGQDYSFGRQVARATKEYLASKRPDIEIVGDELHPIAQISDFTPYVNRIMDSEADVVITGNWGADLARLINAAHASKLEASIYTLYAGMSSGVMQAVMSQGGEDIAEKVKQVGNWHPNIENFPGKEIQESFKNKYQEDFYATPTFTIVSMLSKAINETGSTDPVKIAFAMEGMSVKGLGGAEAKMRAADHQLQQTQYISTWTQVNGKDVVYDQEDTGYGWRPEHTMTEKQVSKQTTCEMARP